MFCSLHLLLMRHLKRKTVFLQEKAAIYIYFDFTYTVYGRFYTSTEGVVAPERVRKIIFAIYKSTLRCICPHSFAVAHSSRPLFGQNSPQTGTRGSRKTFLATLLYNVSQITIPFTQDMDSSGQVWKRRRSGLH